MSRRTNNFNRCDVCGRFFSFEDIENGQAIHQLITPDSSYSCEEWGSLCKEHIDFKVLTD